MPRYSYRSRALDKIRDTTYDSAKVLFVIDQVLDSDDVSISINFETPSFYSYLRIKSHLDDAISTGYFQEQTCRKSKTNMFEHDLYKGDNGITWLNDEEFKQKYRMSREMLAFVCDETKDCEVFKRRLRGTAQRPVKNQLIMLLHFPGQEGQFFHKVWRLIIPFDILSGIQQNRTLFH